MHQRPDRLLVPTVNFSTSNGRSRAAAGQLAQRSSRHNVVSACYLALHFPRQLRAAIAGHAATAKPALGGSSAQSAKIERPNFSYFGAI